MSTKDSRKKRKKRAPKWNWKDHWIPILILAACIIAPYAQTLTFEYVLDDKIVFTENNYAKEGFSGIPKILNSDSFRGYFGEQKDLLMGARYRPFSIAAFAVEYGLVGDTNAPISHAINVFMYLMLGVLIYYLIFRLNIKWPYTSWYLSLPFVVSLIFVLHPIHIEAVANVKGRDEIMTLGIALLSMLFYYNYYKKGKIFQLILGSLFFFASLMFKENALTFFAVIPAALWVFRKYKASRMIPAIISLVIPVIIYFIIRINVIGYLLEPPNGDLDDLLNHPFLEMNLAQKYATISYTLGEYLRLLVFPHPLTHDYYPYHIPIMEWTDWRVLLAFVLNLGLFLLGILGLIRKKAWGFALFFYFTTLSIVSNAVVSIGVFMNERFAFMPSLAFALLLPLAIHSLLKNQTRQKFVLMGVIGLFSLGYLFQNFNRVPDWKNPYTLNASAIEVSENSARANCFMAVELYKKSNEETDPAIKQDLVSRAKEYIDRSLEIYPEYGSALKMKAGILGAQYSLDRDLQKLLIGFERIMFKRNISYISEYLDYLEKNDANHPELIDFYREIGFETYCKKLNNSELCLSYLNRALELNPGHPGVNRDLAYYFAERDLSKARPYAERAIQYFPEDSNLLNVLGL